MRTPTGSLPRTSRAEAQIQESNYFVAMQLRLMQHQQQTQFELNQLRQERDRIRSIAPPTIIGPRICTPGEIGC